jgi:hypothetical protein
MLLIGSMMTASIGLGTRIGFHAAGLDQLVSLSFAFHDTGSKHTAFDIDKIGADDE